MLDPCRGLRKAWEDDFSNFPGADTANHHTLNLTLTQSHKLPTAIACLGLFI